MSDQRIKIATGTGYLLGECMADGPVVVGGACGLQGAISPNTGLPLTQHAAVKLGVSGFVLPDWDVPEIHFLYSWKCCISEGDFSYRYVADRLELIEYTTGAGDFDGFPYRHYPVVFPAVRFLLRPVAEGDQELMVRLNGSQVERDVRFEDARADRLSIPTHQFGGMPFLLDPSMEQKPCVLCGGEMELVASIGNQCFSHEEGFFGNDFVQLVYFGCGRCQVLSAVNVAD